MNTHMRASTMTIYDIAEKAGVSASTVSRVVNNKPGVGEKTRKRILALLEENNYTPDIAARSLAIQSSRFIGILIEDIRVHHHTDAVYLIEQEMQLHGYTCITLSTGADLAKKKEYIRILEQRRVEGVIMVGSMFGEKGLESAITDHLPNIPVVLVNGDMDLPNVYCVIVDEERGIAECVSYLVRNGRRKIVFMNDVDTPSNRRKFSGYQIGVLRNGCEERALRAAGQDTNPQDSLARGRKAAEEILARYPDADAIICGTDMLAVGCLHFLHENGYNVPDDIAVIGVDNTIYGKIVTPTLSTLDNKIEDTSSSAARILLDALEQKALTHKVILPATIIERASTAFELIRAD